MFYDVHADTKVRLADGKILRFSKYLLCSFTKSPVLHQLFFGNLRDEVTDILDVNCDTFKLFLDCLMNFAPYTKENSMQIFPVAWKYQVDECLNKIVEALTPTDMSITICEILNMAKFYQCDRLVLEVERFLCKRHRYRILMEKEEYSSRLSIDSFKAMLSMIDYRNGERDDSYVLDCIFKWAEDHVKVNHPNQEINLKEFLEKNKFDIYINPGIFETTGSMIRFCESRFGDHFTGRNIAFLMQNVFVEHKESQWVIVNAGESITERFSVYIPFFKRKFSSVEIERGSCIFYDGPEEEDEDQNIVTLTVVVEEKNKEIDFQLTSETWPLYELIIMNIPSNENKAKSIHISITWAFKYDCRILKISHSSYDGGDDNLLYFTRSRPTWRGVEEYTDRKDVLTIV